MTWHADPEVLDRYAAGRLQDARAFSVESHLLTCPACRARIADHVDPGPLERVWEAVVDRIEAPTPGPVERLLVRLGVREHLARLLAATPSLRLSWLAAVAAVLGFAVIAARSGPETWRAWSFLVLAPLVPVAGVAAAYGPGLDPAYEVGVAAPLRGFRLLLLRSVAVLATSLPLTALVALALPGLDWTAGAWLLPALGLTLTTLAASTMVGHLLAAGAVTWSWLALVATVARLAEGRPVLFGPEGQAGFLALAALAVAVLAARHHRFETLQRDL